MNKFIEQYVERVLRQRKRRIVQLSVLAILSVAVVLAVVFALMLNGEGQAKIAYCGEEEHIHTDECITKTLICDYQSEGEHTHTDACYENGTLVCNEAEHTHSSTCYTEEKILTCENQSGGGYYL